MLIFVSYARNDDLDRPSARAGDRYGFVTTVVRSAERTLTDAGVTVLEPEKELAQGEVSGPHVAFFIDKRDVPDDVQFGDAIPDELTKADVFLAVLSNNWVLRSWCLKELQYFAKRFPDEAAARKRIVVINKNAVVGSIPALLQGQNGVRFFRPDRDQIGGSYEFFRLNEGPREGFDDAVDRLADIVERRARENGPPPPPPVPDKPLRQVFVAKPAPDMDEWYRKFVGELQRRDFTVVPDPDKGFSSEMTEPQIAAALDEALHDSELSVHLLGNSRGFTPADGDQSIVQLQALRAAERRASRLKNDAGVAFQRLFWVPKVLIVNDDVVGSVRDPEEVRARVTERIDEDTVFSENFTKFTQFVLDRLRATAPPLALTPLHAGANVYLEYQPPSEQYAARVGVALRARNLEVNWQRRAGPDALAKHKQFLRECDAVVVCWGEGSDGDALSPFDEMNVDPRQLGRDKGFACRSLVVGPPEEVPGKTIALSLAENKDDGVDLVLNLTKYADPPPSEFDPLVNAAQHHTEPAPEP